MKRVSTAITAAVLLAAMLSTPASAAAVGDTAPAIEGVEIVKGADVKKGFEQGKVYAITFWATWCPVSRQTMPFLTSLQKKYAGKAVIVGVSSEKPKDIKAFADKMGTKMDFVVVADTAKRTGKAYMADFQKGKKKRLPVTFLIDKDGKLAWMGSPTKMAPRLKELVEEE